MTERALLAKYLRGAATYHRPQKTSVTVSWPFLTRLRALGVTLEPPAGRTDPGELTPDQAERYADALEAS